MSKEYLYRALFFTMNLVEKEEEINKNTIQEYGHENNISKLRIERYKNEIEELKNMIIDIENQ